MAKPDPALAPVTGSAVDPYEVRIGGVKADPYRIARAYGITDPVLFQALKKLLRCGRKHKDIRADAREARTTIERWEAMNAEDDKPNAGTQRPGASDAPIANQSAPPGSLE